MTPEEWRTIRHFTPEEFDCPGEPGTGLGMDYDFMRRLDFAREIAGVPFVVTSGYRSEAHNESVGGRPLSAHLKGKAGDIATPTASVRYHVLRGAYLAGFRRIEIAPRHVHLDSMEDPAHPVELALFLDPQTGRIV